MTTGGNTSGKCTNASRTVRPTNCLRVNTHASKTAKGRLKRTLRDATLKLKASASLSLALSQITIDLYPYMLLNGAQDADHEAVYCASVRGTSDTRRTAEYLRHARLIRDVRGWLRQQCRGSICPIFAPRPRPLRR